MNKKFNIVFISLFVVFATLLYIVIFTSDWSSAGTETTAAGIKPGKRTPAVDFTLSDLEGRRVKLSDLKGKVVFLNFWATWCGPCRIEIPTLAKMNQKFKDRDFQLLTISIDQQGRKAIEPFYQQLGIALPTLVDSDSKVASRYGVSAVPESFLIDKEGRIVKKYIGPRDWVSPSIISEIERLL